LAMLVVISPVLSVIPIIPDEASAQTSRPQPKPPPQPPQPPPPPQPPRPRYEPPPRDPGPPLELKRIHDAAKAGSGDRAKTLARLEEAAKRAESVRGLVRKMNADRSVQQSRQAYKTLGRQVEQLAIALEGMVRELQTLHRDSPVPDPKWPPDIEWMLAEDRLADLLVKTLREVERMPDPVSRMVRPSKP